MKNTPTPDSRIALGAPDGLVIAALIVLCLALAVSCTTMKDTPELEGSGPIIDQLEAEVLQSPYGMVATALPDASRIAVEVLESGGTAIDAAVAAAFALGVADPGDSGLGGSTHIVIRFADGRATVIDGSAVVPMRIDRRRLQKMRAEGIKWGMEFAAVPTTLAVLDYTTTRFGTFSLADLIAPSITLATSGYYATPFQEVSIRRYFDDLLQSDFLKYFVLDGGESPPRTTELQCRPILARTLQRIAEYGSSDFYRGEIAAEIAADMEARGGFVRRRDLANVRVREIRPLRGRYRGAVILAHPYPSIGGAVIEALNIFEHYPSEFFTLHTSEQLQVIAEAFHMATVDHERLLPVRTSDAVKARRQLLTEEHAAKRSAMIKRGEPVVGRVFAAPIQAPDVDGNTTQVSIVDRWGNAVSLTQSVGRFFGNKMASPRLGFPYNSLLEGQDHLSPQALIPTFMCPTIVAREGRVLLVLGTAASSRIPGVVATVISNIVDRDLPLREAILAPRILWSTSEGERIYVEVFPPIEEAEVDELGGFGYEPMFRTRPPVRQSRFTRFGAVNAVYVDPDSGEMSGVGDPRRNGHAQGVRF